MKNKKTTKRNNNIPLQSHWPTIDLHGEDRKSAELLVKDFLNDLCKLKSEKGIIIHGIGTGTLKKTVHEVLKYDKRIEKYYIDFWNIGCTIVEFKNNN